MTCLETHPETQPATTNSGSSESARLQAVYATGLLDTPPEIEFEELTALAAALCGAPIGAISLLDEHRQWFKSIVGLDIKETPRQYSFCDHTIRQPGILVVEDARGDLRFATNPYV